MALQLPQISGRFNVFSPSPSDGQVLASRGSRQIYETVESTAISITVGPGGDFTTIAAALANLGSSAGSIHVAAGTYTITEALKFGGNDQSIIGDGWGTIITTATGSITMIDADDKDRINIRNLKMDGQDTASVIGIDMTNSDDSRVSNCWIEDMGGIGISAGSADRFIVRECQVTSGGNIGILISGSACFIIDCQITSNTGNGITMGGSINMIQQCYIALNGDRGILIDGSTACVMGNVIFNNTSYGIHLGNANSVTMVGNILKQNNGTNDAQLYLYSSDWNTIVGNMISVGDDYGIEIYDAASDNNVVVANYLGGNDEVGLLDNGTGTIADHNQV